ncbi:uncharacterized protein LOC143017778 [Oratosquilla oratoria]|uniref:uncharacterized protein LOC143017778 n=1 Tax=Oratosquilla oratoria TaxID=337810 RepID=UPI003F75A344
MRDLSDGDDKTFTIDITVGHRVDAMLVDRKRNSSSCGHWLSTNTRWKKLRGKTSSTNNFGRSTSCVRTLSCGLVTLLCLMALPQWTQAKKRRPYLASSLPSVCTGAEVLVTSSRTGWMTSPGQYVKTVTDGNHSTCYWNLKAPAGYGLSLEVVAFRLRKGSQLLIQGGPFDGKDCTPLARFRGRGPRSKWWKTPYSEVFVTYSSSSHGKTKTSKTGDTVRRRRTSPSGRPISSNHLGSSKSSSSSSSCRHENTLQCKQERLKRLRSLQYLVNRKQAQNTKDISKYRHSTHQGKKSKQRLRTQRNHTLTSDTLPNEIYKKSNITFITKKDRQNLPNTDEATLDIVTLHSDDHNLQFLDVGQPTWFSFTGTIGDGQNISTDLKHSSAGEYSHGYDTKSKKRKKVRNHKSSKNNKMVKNFTFGGSETTESNSEFLVNTTEASGTAFLADGTDNVRPYRSISSRHESPRSNSRRQIRYYKSTIETGTTPRSGKRYKIAISRHKQWILTFPRRGYTHILQCPRSKSNIIRQENTRPMKVSPSTQNKITKNLCKPTKSSGSKKKTKTSSGMSKRVQMKHKSKSGLATSMVAQNNRRRREYFVIKVHAHKTKCGGEMSSTSGKLTSPSHSGNDQSCYWKFKTPKNCRWTFECRQFEVRKSRECRKDHLALRVNQGQWTRYCGTEGPSITIRSNRGAEVDVILNTQGSKKARVVCNWRTGTAGSYHHYSMEGRSDLGCNMSRTSTPSPPTSTAMTTTTTTSAPTLKPIINDTTLFGVALPSPRCENYIHFSQQHTMCKKAPSSCALHHAGITPEERVLILQEHNKYRAKVARGEEANGHPGPQYSASDMMQFEWNEELAVVAQAWASTCPTYHDCHDCRKVISRNYDVGQNIFYEWTTSNSASVWETAVRLWYEEVKYVPRYFANAFRLMRNVKIGHYTQMVWSSTRELGCGAIYYNCNKYFRRRYWKMKCKIYVCNYGPAGNYMRKPMYKIGPPASECPEGSWPSSMYPGLCSVR